MREAGNSGAAIAHGRSAVELGALAMAENGNAVPYLDARTRLGEALFFSDRHASLAEFEAVVEALPRYGLEGTRLHLDAFTGLSEQARSEESRVGQGCVRPCESRWSPNHKKN